MMYYISYGSNMNISQMAYRCPNSKIYGNGIIKGWKLVFNHHADIINTGNATDFVPVVVWKITDEWDLYSLDRYEGYPKYYIRKNIEVTMDNGEVINGMVYVMTENRKGIYPPSYDYLMGIYEGYMENNIDIAPLRKAIIYCCNEDNITAKNQYAPIGGEI